MHTKAMKAVSTSGGKIVHPPRWHVTSRHVTSGLILTRASPRQPTTADFVPRELVQEEPWNISDAVIAESIYRTPSQQQRVVPWRNTSQQIKSENLTRTSGHNTVNGKHKSK